MDLIASLGVDSGEPSAKKIRIDGESYIVAVTEGGSKAIGVEHEKSGSEQQMYLVKRINKSYLNLL